MPYFQPEDPNVSYRNPKPYRGNIVQGQIQFCPQDETGTWWDIIYMATPLQGSIDYCPQDETGTWWDIL